MNDPSNGYDAISEEYCKGRYDAPLGVAEVRSWAKKLRRGAAVADIGCGGGLTLSQTLVDEGIALHGIDASPNMVKAFRKRFPTLPVACQAAEESHFFAKKFDGVLAWGLLFLLNVKTQAVLIRKIGTVMKPKGRFLFTSPPESCTWKDAKTGQQSQSPGREVYSSILLSAGFSIEAEYKDEGNNYYYDAVKV